MRTAKGDYLCDMLRLGDKPRGCKTFASFDLFCSVEGRAFSFCKPCGDAWKTRALNDTFLQGRCPNCSRHIPAPTVVPIDQNPPNPVTDVFHEAIDHAMKMEGVLEPDRKRIMARLAHEAPWMCQKPLEPAS